MSRLYASFEGFKYYIKEKPLLGAYVSMETFARGLLKYGTYEEYHTYFDESFLPSLAKEELKRLFFADKGLKLKGLKRLVGSSVPEYKIIHFEQLVPDKELIFRRLLKNKNVPVTRTVYTVATNAHLRELLDVSLLGLGGRPYDSIIVLSHQTKEVLMSYFSDLEGNTEGRAKYNGRIDVIPVGIDLEAFQPIERATAREKYRIPQDATVLLSLARISSISKFNYRRLIELFSRITLKTDKKLFLVIAGSDPNSESRNFYPTLEKLNLADKTKFITNFKDEEKPVILSTADIFVSLSDNLQESFGIALIEAMSMGLPVICTDWDGYKDIVKDGETGFRIPIKWKVTADATDILVNFRHPYDHAVIHRISNNLIIDDGVLGEKILILVENEAIRKQMGAKGKQDVTDRFTIKEVIRQYEELWDELDDMAQRDKKEYKDLGDLLYYDYPKHFASYPTEFEYEIE